MDGDFDTPYTLSNYQHEANVLRIATPEANSSYPSSAEEGANFGYLFSSDLSPMGVRQQLSAVFESSSEYTFQIYLSRGLSSQVQSPVKTVF